VRTPPGIYVEIPIQTELDVVWRLTQQPELHQRWDLRFTRIEYLPRLDPAAPQQFLYETRIGFGLAIRGTGESIAQRQGAGGETTSSLKFASADPKSLIETGSGYWKYIPAETGLRFLTWYDYEVRFGAAGRLVDALLFRPLMGWATAWSFDCLRLWAEERQTPEASVALSAAHAVARVSIALIWVWHGLVPKLLYASGDEQRMLAEAGVSLRWLPWMGMGEILFGTLILLGWRRRSLFPVNAAVMVLATFAVAAKSPEYLSAAFNPVTLNFAMIALSLIGWLVSGYLPSASRCLRKPVKPIKDEP
jgi:uncharacterized membrane protein YphA (DoxX/SURF4 family)